MITGADTDRAGRTSSNFAEGCADRALVMSDSSVAGASDELDVAVGGRMPPPPVASVITAVVVDR